MQAEEFFRLLYRDEVSQEACLVLSCPTKRGRGKGLKVQWFNRIDAAAKWAAEKTDVYFNACLMKPDESTNTLRDRGSAKHAVVMPGFWLDIDVGDHGNGKALPPTLDDAYAVVKELPWEADCVLETGGGLHVWHLFQEGPWKIGSDELRGDAAAMEYTWQKIVRGEMKRRGWDLDSTHDLARMMRVPGTRNGKW